MPNAECRMPNAECRMPNEGGLSERCHSWVGRLRQGAFVKLKAETAAWGEESGGNAAVGWRGDSFVSCLFPPLQPCWWSSLGKMGFEALCFSFPPLYALFVETKVRQGADGRKTSAAARSRFRASRGTRMLTCLRPPNRFRLRLWHCVREPSCTSKAVAPFVPHCATAVQIGSVAERHPGYSWWE